MRTVRKWLSGSGLFAEDGSGCYTRRDSARAGAVLLFVLSDGCRQAGSGAASLRPGIGQFLGGLHAHRISKPGGRPLPRDIGSRRLVANRRPGLLECFQARAVTGFRQGRALLFRYQDNLHTRDLCPVDSFKTL